MSTETTLHIGGERTTGDDIRTQNVMAAMSIANIVKTSLGPIGLDKMLVDEVGDVTISNDGATILKMLDIEHPAAKILVGLADLQDKEVGDGTTSVVIVAAELLRVANELVKQKIHPTTVISGFRLAQREACKYIAEHMAIKMDSLGPEVLVNCVKTCLSSKIIGSESEFFAKMVVDAMQGVKRVNSKGQTKYPVSAVNVLKAHGGSLKESVLIDGYALNQTAASQMMVKKVPNAKIACLDINLMKSKMQMGVQVLINDPQELERIRKRESDITKERIEKILAAGANVIFTTKGIDDMCLKYFIDAGAMAVRRCKKEDLKRIARMTGATFTMTLADEEGNESFTPDLLGEADLVLQERVADDELMIIKGCRAHKSSSILLRGANDYMLDEMERSVHDALCALKRVLESNKVVPGGGAVEAALSIYLELFATSLGSREQLAVAEYSRALLAIPKTLSVNAAKDASDLVAKLRAYHNKSQTDPARANLRWVGLDLVEGTIRDNVKAGVLEPALSKVKSLKFATEAAITILRIDDMIKMQQEHKQDKSAYQRALEDGSLEG